MVRRAQWCDRGEGATGEGKCFATLARNETGLMGITPVSSIDGEAPLVALTKLASAAATAAGDRFGAASSGVGWKASSQGDASLGIGPGSWNSTISSVGCTVSGVITTSDAAERSRPAGPGTLASAIMGSAPRDLSSVPTVVHTKKLFGSAGIVHRFLNSAGEKPGTPGSVAACRATSLLAVL
jgi:hypothetical protein